MERLSKTPPALLLTLAASAIAYPVSFPPVGWIPLAPISVAMLMASLLRDPTPRRGFYVGLAWGMVAFGTGLSWMWRLFGPFAVLLWAVLAFYPAVFGWLVAHAQRRGLSGGRLALFAAAAWTGTEFLRCEVMPLRFPWLHLGLALEPWPLVSWVGVYGLGFVAAWVMAALVTRRWWLAAGLVIAGAVAAVVEATPRGEAPWPMFAVSAVQAETAPLATYLGLSEQAGEGTALIVWPEYAVPKDARNAPAEELKAIQELAARKKALVVFGTQTRREGVKWQNTALTVDGHDVVGEHGKNHPVHFFDDGERGATAASFKVVMPVEGNQAFPTQMGTPICFDCDFHDVVRRMVADGAQFLAVPSMDAVSWSARQHIQHSQLFRVRAAENRRCMVVAASSGVSQIIDTSGRAMHSLNAMRQGILNGQIYPSSKLTYFTHTGWLTPWAVLATLVVWTTWLLAFSPQEKRRSQS